MGPLFSHILQVAAYCLLIQATGKNSEYGILKYGTEVEHEIEFTEELRNLLINKLNEMESARKTGIVHRNHNRVGKCRKCSRRNICPEKLA
jgi:CRISPR-associated exonuclease Cas4